MAIYTIEPDAQTLHGFFSPDLPPVLTIDSGDTIRFRTLDADWGLEPFTTFVPPGPPPRRRATTTVVGPMGHALCGPIAIRGAQPGMTLAIRIDALRPGPWGWTWAGGDLVDGEVLHRWELDLDALRGRNQYGHQVALRPFMGVMGMPPAEPGQHATVPPRVTGGNLDCKELVVGSTLYLPIAVPGGLFSVGDGHALQGDGEVSRIAQRFCQSLQYIQHLLITALVLAHSLETSYLCCAWKQPLLWRSMYGLSSIGSSGLEGERAVARCVGDLRRTGRRGRGARVHGRRLRCRRELLR